MTKYLLCEPCGLHRFYGTNDAGEKVYFHVGYDYEPFPTQASNADLAGLDFSEIFCCGCSWSGSINQLVKYV
ncbi:MAG: hypothetical protein HN742_25770 [Lentisphaerae bacterium]|jgi:hypothetical protein|nr:hypothetical protein [Lentisphaerota bacterium]MBT4819462.1 hypothetical protein [Lentisphaerota bacterium]MBT5604782.1 hypothetical protein [Lentisphaerota bacterium]MBT7057026.1 hypothetical protein [Lentisphaerota bacterium]MBT7845309.1 hypothetical protein [Lentisphaerota bacterium]